MIKQKKTKNRKTNPKRTTGLNKEIRRLGVFIEDTNDNVKLLAEQHGDMKKTLDSHTEMIGDMRTDLTIIKEDIEFIKNSVKRKLDIEEFAALERRVALLEKRR